MTSNVKSKIKMFESDFCGSPPPPLPPSASSNQDMNTRTSDSTVNSDGLVLPRKLYNPCLESKELREVHREMQWNAKTGINVLGGKSELKLIMEKRDRSRIERERQTEREVNKTQFQKILDERAKRLQDEVPRESDSGHCSPEPESEFLKIHAQLTHGGKKL